MFVVYLRGALRIQYVEYMEYMLILQADNCTGNNDLIFLLLQPFPFGGELFSEHDHLLYPQLSVSR